MESYRNRFRGLVGQVSVLLSWSSSSWPSSVGWSVGAGMTDAVGERQTGGLPKVDQRTMGLQQESEGLPVTSTNGPVVLSQPALVLGASGLGQGLGDCERRQSPGQEGGRPGDEGGWCRGCWFTGSWLVHAAPRGTNTVDARTHCTTANAWDAGSERVCQLSLSGPSSQSAVGSESMRPQQSAIFKVMGGTIQTAKAVLAQAGWLRLVGWLWLDFGTRLTFLV